MTTNTAFKPAGALPAGLLALAALGTFGYAYQSTGVPQFVLVLGAILIALGAFCVFRRHDDLVHDLFLPVVLFAALGGFTWAVRGSSGFGAVKGCVFAGVLWGAAWWYIARNPGGAQFRRYASGWIVLALTIGIGLSGGRGWMQWSSFFEGKLLTNAGANKFVEISPTYGFIWLFIAGVPWAGIGACLLAWCAAERPLAAWKWAVRLFCGFGMAYFLNHLYQQHPQWFLPLYGSMEERYKDLDANPNLGRLMRDNGHAIRHMGLFLGFLLFELGRRDWRNVVLITTVGLVNGFGWALCQNWKWAPEVFGETGFNWWRAWESCGGISIGVAYGIAYYLVNRPMPPGGPVEPRVAVKKPGKPWFGIASVLFLLVPLVWFLVEAGAGFGEDIARLPGAVMTLFPIGHEGPEVYELFQLDRLAFVLVLAAGVLLYGRRLWKGIKQPNADAGNGSDDVPALRAWFPRYVLLLLIAFFLMGSVRFGWEGEATIWWARFDYWILAIALGYGLIYPVLHAFRSRGTRQPRVSSFYRYPNLDWLATYLILLVIAAAFLQGELPAWKGWFGAMGEETARWYGLLGPALIAVFGVVYYLSVLLPSRDNVMLDEAEPVRLEPNLERLGVYLGLVIGLGMSLKNGARGWANIYLDGDEYTWGNLYWSYIGPVMLGVLALSLLLVLFRRIPLRSGRDPLPRAGMLVLLAVVWQNIIGQAITGPITNWNEMAFNIYYFLLFLISAVILYHYHAVKKLGGLCLVMDAGVMAVPGAAATGALEPMSTREGHTEAIADDVEDSPDGAFEAESELEEETSGWTPDASNEAPEDSVGWTPEAADEVPVGPVNEDVTIAIEPELDAEPRVENAGITPGEDEAIALNAADARLASDAATPPDAEKEGDVTPPDTEPLGVSVMVDMDDIEEIAGEREDKDPIDDMGEEVLPGVPSPQDFDLVDTPSGGEPKDSNPFETEQSTPPAETGPPAAEPDWTPEEGETTANPDDDHTERDDPRF